MKKKMADSCRAVDPHSFFADQDPAVLLNAHPDPAVKKCGLGSSLTKFVTDYFMKCGNKQKKLLKSYKQWRLSTFN